MPTPPDRCPKCQQPNHCAVAAAGGDQSHCWCMQETLSLPVPDDSERACLCQACIGSAAAGTHMP
jgi:hypothetical protein